MHDKIREYRTVIDDLCRVFDRKPTRSEIAKSMNVSVVAVENIECATLALSTFSLDKPVSEDGDDTLADYIADGNDSEYENVENRLTGLRLWDRVESKLEPSLASTILLRYRDGVSLQAQAERNGAPVVTMWERCDRARMILRKDKEIRAIGKEFGYSPEYNHRHVTLAQWNATFTSAVEQEVLHRETDAERRLEEPLRRIVKATVKTSDAAMDSVMEWQRKENERRIREKRRTEFAAQSFSPETEGA